MRFFEKYIKGKQNDNHNFSLFVFLLVVSAANGYSEHPDVLHRAETPQPRKLCEGEKNTHTHTHTHTHRG